MVPSAAYFSLLLAAASGLLFLVCSQQVTPIIGGKCDINAPDVPIGGKQTQFFLKCEHGLQSENGKGIWVVKSRSASATTLPMYQTNSSVSPPVAEVPYSSTNSNNREHPQQFHKQDSSVCVQDKSARENDPCSVSSLCLQQDQQQLSHYLQCDQSNSRWVKKSCLDGQTFSFEHQACIVQSANPFKQSRLGTPDTTDKRYQRNTKMTWCTNSNDCEGETICIDRICTADHRNGTQKTGYHPSQRRPCNGHPRCQDGHCGWRMKCFSGCCVLSSCPSDLPPLMFVRCSHHRDCPEQMFCFGSFCCPQSDREQLLLKDYILKDNDGKYLASVAEPQPSKNSNKKGSRTTVPIPKANVAYDEGSSGNTSVSLDQPSDSLLPYANGPPATDVMVSNNLKITNRLLSTSIPEETTMRGENPTVPENFTNPAPFKIPPNFINSVNGSVAEGCPTPLPILDIINHSENLVSVVDGIKNCSNDERVYLFSSAKKPEGINRIIGERRNDLKYEPEIGDTAANKNFPTQRSTNSKAYDKPESLLELVDIFNELIVNLKCNLTELGAVLETWLLSNLAETEAKIQEKGIETNENSKEQKTKIFPSRSFASFGTFSQEDLPQQVLDRNNKSRSGANIRGKQQTSRMLKLNTSATPLVNRRHDSKGLGGNEIASTLVGNHSMMYITQRPTTVSRPSLSHAAITFQKTPKAQQSSTEKPELFSSTDLNFNLEYEAKQIKTKAGLENATNSPAHDAEAAKDQEPGNWSTFSIVYELEDADESSKLERANIWQEECFADRNCLQLGFCPNGYICRNNGDCCTSAVLCPNDLLPSSECFDDKCISSEEICLKTANDLYFCCRNEIMEYGILLEESTLGYNYSGNIFNVFRGGHHASSVPSSLAGIVCTFMQCSQNNPCQRGTCNNGYCCTSPIGGGLFNQPYAAPVIQHQQPLVISQPLISLPNQVQTALNATTFTTGATANPFRNPFVCLDGTQAVGACILGQCGGSFSCRNGLCCNGSSYIPRCLDGALAVGACLRGQCGAGFMCTTGNVCCPSTSTNVTAVCPNGGTSIGGCINGLCPTGYTCINGQCCPSSGNRTFTCSNLNYVLGPCVGNQCPDAGFECDTMINSCCPRTEPVGPCIQPGNQCPNNYRCFTAGVTPVCYRICDGRGTRSGEPVNGACAEGTTLIFGDCCTLTTRFYNAKPPSFLSEHHVDYLYSASRSTEVGRCPDGTSAVSACINGLCGHGYQCYNNFCCPAQSANLMLPFSSATLRPIGGQCEFTQQCASSMEGLSICELNICRCLPGTYVNGFVCVKRFNILLSDAEGSSSNGTSPDIFSVTDIKKHSE